MKYRRKAFIKNFGLKQGALASSVAHDSHNIVAVGVDDESIFKAIDYIIKAKGGVCYYNGSNAIGLSLPVFGLMGFDSAQSIAKTYQGINTYKFPWYTVSDPNYLVNVARTRSMLPKEKFECEYGD